MLDKIHLYTSEYEIKNDAKLNIIPCAIDNASGEYINPSILWYDGRVPKMGQRAFNNQYGANITLKHGRVHVSYNPGKMILGNNFHDISYEQIKESLLSLQNSFSEIGIKANLENCLLSRIDICKNIETLYGFDTYKPALELISPKYMPYKDSTLHDGYYLKGNRTIQFCFYDKLGELRARKFDPKTMGILTPNITRQEIRFMNHRGIKTHLGIDTIGELNTLEHFHYRKETYKHFLNDRFFQFKENTKRLDHYKDDKELLIGLRSEYPNKAVELFIMHKQMTGKHDPISIDYITSLMQGVYGNTSIRDKKIQLMNLFQYRLKSRKNEILRVTYPELLHELHEKLVA